MSPTEFIKEESGKIKKEVRERTLGYILTALGLVAGLAWNEVIKSLIGIFFPSEQNTLLAQFIYAIVVTVVIVIVATYLSRYLHKEEMKK